MLAETAILSCIINSPHVYLDVHPVISADDFSSLVSADIYSSIARVASAGKPIDIVTITADLKAAGAYSTISEGYIESLVSKPYDAANAIHYADEIKQQSIRRRVQLLGQQMADIGEDKAPSEALDEAYSQILQIAERSTIKSTSSIGDVVSTVARDAIEVSDGVKKRTGIRTGIERLDAILNMMEPSDYYILAARPSVGKTALAINIAMYVARIHGPVLFCSLEMAERQLGERILSSESGVPLSRITTGYLSKADKAAIESSTGALHSIPLTVDDRAAQSLMDIRVKARQVQSRGGLSLLCIDYLGLVRSGVHGLGKYEEVGRVSNGLKAIAKDLGVPVLCLAQLNRSNENEQRRPRLSDLRDSGNIEQDADGVIFIYPASGSTVELIVAKHRQGETGICNATFDKQLARFS